MDFNLNFDAFSFYPFLASINSKFAVGMGIRSVAEVKVVYSLALRGNMAYWTQECWE